MKLFLNYFKRAENSPYIARLSYRFRKKMMDLFAFFQQQVLAEECFAEIKLQLRVAHHRAIGSNASTLNELSCLPN